MTERIVPTLPIIQQFQRNLRKHQQQQEGEENLLDLCTILLSWKMNRQLLLQSKLLIDVKKLIPKLLSPSHRSMHQQIRGLYQEWKDIYWTRGDEQQETEREKYSTMNLEDFLEIDFPVPPFTDRIFLPNNHQFLNTLEKRIHVIKGNVNLKPEGVPVVYWMSRDQRLHDNWAVLYAQQRAIETNSPFCIIFGLTSNFPGANIRSYGFMLRGLKLLQLDCENYNIPFFLLKGSPDEVVTRFCFENNVGTLVTDFSPLLISKQWKQNISSNTSNNLLFVEVDAHNICPVRKVSNKCEFAAKTIRSKIHGHVSEFLTEFPSVQVMTKPSTVNSPQQTWVSSDITDSNPDLGNTNIWELIPDYIKEVDKSVPEVTWLESGEHAAMESLKEFLGIHLNGYSSSNRSISRLDTYAERRNDPSISNGCSGLAPYLHFGQLSSQRICLELKRVKKFNTVNALFPPGERTTSVHSFCEELVVRKELSDNYCFYNENYMSIRGGGAHNWARTTLEEHWNDPREILYSEEQLEKAQTGDNLWNAAQLEMVTTGKMHGFMRMYWAKKILEWTENPDIALRIAIYLNDKYSLDGRDPNGYVGCMWAIAGVHDRAWGPERNIFGKIRYMNYEGCKRKFDIKKYIAAHCPSNTNASTQHPTPYRSSSGSKKNKK